MLVSAKIILITITAILAAVACSIISSYAFSAQKRIDKQGVLGSWFDKAGGATTTIERHGDNYKLIWIASGGYRAEFPLSRRGDRLMKNDPLGISYEISGDRLDIYDNTGFVRSVELKPGA
ncbi:hypothetical protein [Pseudomonas sihuiensis]|uniref:DUF5640 domain-containing protein n=1 Tax=Pseudomonas sihuiensis TaxID=1274359 RepID=A0A1H2LJE4_9PSED|nr:hypothetical protein [Pseudomonas sihuiensis]SDU81140.1 hypothetical protein SAMN05216363_1710 [Pseudomonas sihuiensis]